MADGKKIDRHSIVSRNEAVLFSDMPDGVALMDIDSGNYYHYDPVGGQIWSLLDGNSDVASICRTLQGDYDVDPQTCERETIAFLRELHSLGLVAVAGPVIAR